MQLKTSNKVQKLPRILPATTIIDNSEQLANNTRSEKNDTGTSSTSVDQSKKTSRVRLYVCGYCGEKNITNEMRHLVYDCKEKIVPCTMFHAGCTWEGKLCDVTRHFPSACTFAPKTPLGQNGTMKGDFVNRVDTWDLCKLKKMHEEGNVGATLRLGYVLKEFGGSYCDKEQMDEDPDSLIKRSLEIPRLPQRMWAYGLVKQFGIGCEPDVAISKKFFRFAVENGCIEALVSMGDSKGVDEGRRIRFYKIAYDNKNAVGAYKFASCIMSAIERSGEDSRNVSEKTENRKNMALKAFVSSASQGFFMSQYAAFSFLSKNGSKACLPMTRLTRMTFAHDAFQFIKERAMQKCPAELLIAIGKTYETGEIKLENFEKGQYEGRDSERMRLSVEQNGEKALEFYSRAAEMGNKSGLFLVGMCYEKGIGVRKNPKKSMEIYEELMRFDYEPACYRIAYCYQRGINGLEKNLEKARQIYSISAARGHPDSKNALAMLYYFNENMFQGGETEIKDTKSKADEKDEKNENERERKKNTTTKTASVSKKASGIIKKTSKTKRNEYLRKKVFGLLQEAAQKQHSSAISNLALCYETGYGTDKDVDMAKRLRRTYEMCPVL